MKVKEDERFNERDADKPPHVGLIRGFWPRSKRSFWPVVLTTEDKQKLAKHDRNTCSRAAESLQEEEASEGWGLGEFRQVQLRGTPESSQFLQLD